MSVAPLDLTWIVTQSGIDHLQLCYWNSNWVRYAFQDWLLISNSSARRQGCLNQISNPVLCNSIAIRTHFSPPIANFGLSRQSLILCNLWFTSRRSTHWILQIAHVIALSQFLIMFKLTSQLIPNCSNFSWSCLITNYSFICFFCHSWLLSPLIALIFCLPNVNTGFFTHIKVRTQTIIILLHIKLKQEGAYFTLFVAWCVYCSQQRVAVAALGVLLGERASSQASLRRVCSSFRVFLLPRK